MPRKKTARAVDAEPAELPQIQEILAKAAKIRDRWLDDAQRDIADSIPNILDGVLDRVVLHEIGIEHGWGSEYKLRETYNHETPMQKLIREYARRIAKDFAEPIIAAFTLTPQQVNAITTVMRTEYVEALTNKCIALATEKAIQDAANYLNTQLVAPEEAPLFDADEVIANYANRDW